MSPLARTVAYFMNKTICGRCQVLLTGDVDFCWNCGTLVPKLPQSVPNPALPAASIILSDTDTMNDYLLSGIEIAAWLAGNLCFIPGVEQMIPCKVKNLGVTTFVSLKVTACFWMRHQPLEREIVRKLTPQTEITVAIPFFPKQSGDYLLTRLTFTLGRQDGTTGQWQSKDEILLKAATTQAPAPTIYQVTLQDYAQLFGKLEIGGEQHLWQQIGLVSVETAATALVRGEPCGLLAETTDSADTICLKITGKNSVRYWQLCSRTEAWLGRSRTSDLCLFAHTLKPTAQQLSISGRHARLWLSDGTWLIEDCDSRNGTRIAGMLLKAGDPYPLQDGDVVYLGEKVELLARIYDNQAAPGQPVLRLSHLQEELDEYVVFATSVSIGGVSRCVLPLPDTPSQELGWLAYDGQYRLHVFTNLAHNGRNIGFGETITLRCGDRLTVGTVAIAIE